MGRNKVPNAIKKSITITPRQEQMIEQIMDLHGYPTYSTVFQVALVEKYNKLFPPYQGHNKLPSQEDGNTSGLIGKELQDARQQGEAICKELGGSHDGKKCTYYAYKHRDRVEATVPLENLTDKHVRDQYFPNKKSVVSLQEQGDVNYEV